MKAEERKNEKFIWLKDNFLITLHPLNITELNEE